ncbi:hypothetical protein [Streptomyces sp. MW-W600-10]|uniref:hypothetical protein n=1 Tax=Streptomyces sp. MW-W600-10 TaxID=2829819 RepID=UPI00210D2EC5|nr:hypothetical protein [Streptomyces sp. MW-W600-10]
MNRVEPQITTTRGRRNSFFASASFSSGVSGYGYDTGFYAAAMKDPEGNEFDVV